jgi:hypothetical protein
MRPTVPLRILRRSGICHMDWPSTMRVAKMRLRRSMEGGFMPQGHHSIRRRDIPKWPAAYKPFEINGAKWSESRRSRTGAPFT